MPKVFLSLTMSLDGYIATQNRNPQHPLGEGGIRLHNWMFEQKTDVDARLAEEQFQIAGAVIVGWRTYIDAIHTAWSEENPFSMPAFVVCEQLPEEKDVVDGFIFVVDGVEAALAQARETAGSKDVWVMGGASIAQQYLKAGLLDELRIHLAPVILNQGLRLFDSLGTESIELEPQGAVQTPGATHLTFRVIKQPVRPGHFATIAQ